MSFIKFKEKLQSASVLLALAAMMSSNIDRVPTEVKTLMQEFADIFLKSY